MYLHNVPSSYGRLVQKPEKMFNKEDMLEDNVSLQDQIENLRIKISLKERYNKVLRDEMEESRQGASMIIHDLYAETRNLRRRLMDALNAERIAVHNATRTHRRFQLATQGHLPDHAIPWLDDKLFDMAKRLNFLLYRLYCKRKRLEEVEQMVEQMEKWPRPGTLPWEIEAAEASQKIEYEIENVKVKLETANILHSKYHEIKLILREEKGKYSPVLRALDHQLQNQKKELTQLQNMLADAIVFSNDAAKKLSLTEQEASENKRRRKRQMARMKKAVQKILEQNQLATSANRTMNQKEKRVSFSDSNDTRGGVMDDNELIRVRKMELERFQERTRRIVEAMRVPSLPYVPLRYKTVMDLGQRFEEEQKAKEALRDKLIRQQNLLNLILCYFMYNGQKEETVFQEKKSKAEAELEKVKGEIEEHRVKSNHYGELFIDIRIGLISIMDRFDDPVKKKKKFNKADVMTQIKVLYAKVTRLVESVDQLEKQVPDDPEDKTNYQQYVKPPPVQPRLVRVGTPPKIDESDDEADFGDLKVPGREEIKAKSARFLAQAKLKRGLR